MTDKVLVIDDDPSVAELIKVILKPRGLLTYHAIDGREGLKQAYEIQPDLIILDVMMPEHDGYEICARLREFSDVPILMLTAKSQSSDVTRGFSVGADDYVKKPFSNDELISRIESLIKRKKSDKANTKITGYSDGRLEIELASQKVTLQGEELPLTPTEFKLLAFMIRHPHETLSARTLLTEVWGDAYIHDKALLSLYVHQLRQKLKESETDHVYIKTQWGQGYWFNPLANHEPIETSSEIDNEIDAENEERKTPYRIPNQIWLFGVILVMIFLVTLFVAKNKDSIARLFMPEGESTSLQAINTAEGFVQEKNIGVHGQICVINTGKYPTENLAIVNTIQVIRDKPENYLSRTVAVNQKPVLEPGESYCYPYEIVFEPVPEQNVQYRNLANIMISNYTGLMPGSEHCPDSGSCSFGQSASAAFTIPEP